MNVNDAGLDRENSDWNAQRKYGEDLEFTYTHEFNQPMPFFFTREGNTLPLMGNWRGSVAFIIAGGPSTKQLDLNKLDTCYTMGINNSPKTYRPDSWICVDHPARFLYSIWADPKIMKFVPYGGAEKQIWNSYGNTPAFDEKGKEIRVGDCPNVIFYRRNSKFQAKRWMTECTLNWGNNEKFGGCRSVFLPAIRVLYLLGFRTIYLLGVDFHMSKEYAYHFEQDRDKSAINCNMKTYKRMNEEYFPPLRKEFEEHNLSVYNCNPDSKLTVFDHVPFEDAISHANSVIGDISKESTENMYRDPDEKMGKKRNKKKHKKDNNERIDFKAI